ncbi:hypothetical protein HUG20_08435 [Salicibibacter cibi]|uniref:Uncharacterized protein n=1 Tax=Salicibibacter cibi TaxID=2743001 RepID=A0A7T7CFB0_9BACI|nr:hypothetical protein [Salicibibacter cibi]QQK79908.1 hypothetical protein HUG20_08435 [Salicibibacter cibi]
MVYNILMKMSFFLAGVSMIIQLVFLDSGLGFFIGMLFFVLAIILLAIGNKKISQKQNDEQKH